MAKVLILVQRHQPTEKALIRGAFSQKKRLWAAMMGLVDLTPLVIHDDVTGKEVQASYNAMCGKLRRAGRAVFCEPDNGKRLFMVVEAEPNTIRDWDVCDDGTPRYNPTPDKPGLEGEAET